MRRSPRFHSYDDAVADAEKLLANGYDRAANWSLGQCCSHLSATMERSLDGFPSMLPWPMRVAARWIALGGILKHKQSSRKFPAPKYLLPADAEEDRTALQRFQAVVARLKAHSGELQLHPVFGHLKPAQWVDLHLWHCEHHLSYLVPKKAVR